MSGDGVESFKVPLNVMMKAEDHSANTIAAMIASRATVASQGGRSASENGRKRIMGSGCSSLDLIMSDDNGDEDDIAGHHDKKRRLTFEQVKTLEKNFEVGNKLEPQRKMQLAMALGLQPRQIAVWFQNRRARWKTKQLEKDYDALKCEYESLKFEYDALLRENKKFKSEVQSLSSQLQNEGEIHSEVGGSKASEGFLLKSETSIKTAEPIGVPSASLPGDLVMKKEPEGCNSSIVSEGSSVLNIDSPRTIDSPSSQSRQIGSPPPMEGIRSELPCLRAPLVEQSACQKLPKLEESALNQEESCCNLFYSVEDQQGALLWEYWPQ